MEKIIKRLVWVLCCTLLFFNDLNAQSLDFNLRVGFPTSEFRYASNSTGIGLGGSLLFPIQGQPIYFGVELGYMVHGHSSQNYDQYTFGFRRELELTTNNNMLNGNVVMRLIPTTEEDLYVTPYLEGVVGFNWLYTRTVLRDVSDNWSFNNNDNDNNQIDARVDYSDVALVYGGGMGLMVGRDAMKLNLKCRYLFGSEAEYLDKESVELDSNSPQVLNYNSKTSLTHMILPEVGLVFLW